MANSDPRESFPALEDASGVGVPATKSVEGDSATGKVGQTVFAFKDVNGNIVLPQLDYQGRLPVTSEGQGTRMRAPATSVAGALLGGPSYTFQQILSLPATTGKTYGDFNGSVNCRRGALFQLIYKDNASQVVLDEAMVDSGSYKQKIGLSPDDSFTVPASAVAPAFVIQGGNFDKASDLHAALAVVQF